MFDKIAMADKKIKIAKYIIKGNKQLPGSAKTISQEQWAFTEKEKDDIIAGLTKAGTEYQVEQITVPEDIQQFDGQEFLHGRDEALLYVNGVGKYNPVLLEIERLKTQLSSMDYKTSKNADGEYTSEEWAEVISRRRTLRQQIRQLEEKLNGDK